MRPGLAGSSSTQSVRKKKTRQERGREAGERKKSSLNGESLTRRAAVRPTSRGCRAPSLGIGGRKCASRRLAPGYPGARASRRGSRTTRSGRAGHRFHGVGCVKVGQSLLRLSQSCMLDLAHYTQYLFIRDICRD